MGLTDRATEIPTEARPPLLRRCSDFLFGYDYFISYAWVDGRAYALALKRELQSEGFECFLDSEDYLKGENWKIGGRRAIRKTSRLILVGSAGALASDPVLRELEAFHRTGRRIVPIDFGDTLFPDERGAAHFQFIEPEVLAIREAGDRLGTGPSEVCLQALRSGFDLQRQDRKRLRWLSAIAATLAALLVATVFAATGFWRQRDEARRQRDVATARNLAFEASENSARNPRTAARQFLSSLELAEATKTLGGLFKLLRADPHVAMRQLQPKSKITAVHYVGLAPRIVLGLEDGSVVVWDVPQERSNEGEATLAGAQSVFEFRGDGQRILAVGFDAEVGDVSALDENGSILRWPLQAKGAVRAERAFPCPRTDSSFDNEGPGAALSDDGRTAIWVCDDGRLSLWRQGLGTETLPLDGVLPPVTMSRDGRLLAYQSWNSEKRQVQAQDYDLDLRKGLGSWSPPRNFGGISALTFDDSGRWLAAGLHIGAILVWDREGAASPKMLLVGGETGFGARGRIPRLAFGGHGAYLASYHGQSWQIWDARTGSDFAEIPGTFEPLGAFDGRGERLLVVSPVEGAQVIDYSLESLRALGCQLAAVNFSREEWQRVAGSARYICPCPQAPGCSP
jgi:hypothetical protein